LNDFAALAMTLRISIPGYTWGPSLRSIPRLSKIRHEPLWVRRGFGCERQFQVRGVRACNPLLVDDIWKTLTASGGREG
jgi:hypothetical protein